MFKCSNLFLGYSGGQRKNLEILDYLKCNLDLFFFPRGSANFCVLKNISNSDVRIF